MVHGLRHERMSFQGGAIIFNSRRLTRSLAETKMEVVEAAPDCHSNGQSALSNSNGRESNGSLNHDVKEEDLKEICPRPSVLRNPARKAKRIRFLCNGDRFFKGVVIPITSERFRSFDSLMSHLTRSLGNVVTLPCGVRTIYTMDGRKVSSVDQLEDGKEYVCSGSGDAFKRIDYPSPNEGLSSKKKSSVMSSLISTDRPHSIPSNRSGIPDFVTPRIITLVRSGTKPRKIFRLLINRRNAHSMDHVFSSITETVKLDTGATRKVFSLSGVQVSELKDFFGDESVFFVYGSERYSSDDFELDSEESKQIQAHKKGYNSLKRTSDNTSKSGSQGGVPRMPPKSKVGSPKTQTNDIAAEPEIPPEIVDKYVIKKTIGHGNFAEVQHCVDRATGIEYALKVIDKSKFKGKEHMIVSEVDILRRVRHRNIVRLFSEHDTPANLYLIMELVKGGDLCDAIMNVTKFSEGVASVMIHNLASALYYLHSLSIVHRDIKPENLLVELDGDEVRSLKLADFGLAQKVTGPLYTVCGTPTYVAPEILAESGYGLKIDVWAAGVILYILLCGFPPFSSAQNDQEELFSRILAGRFSFRSPYWDDISDMAKNLVAHMLQLTPDLRFSAEDVLDHPWLSEAGGG